MTGHEGLQLHCRLDSHSSSLSLSSVHNYPEVFYSVSSQLVATTPTQLSLLQYYSLESACSGGLVTHSVPQIKLTQPSIEELPQDVVNDKLEVESLTLSQTDTLNNETRQNTNLPASANLNYVHESEQVKPRVFEMSSVNLSSSVPGTLATQTLIIEPLPSINIVSRQGKSARLELQTCRSSWVRSQCVETSSIGLASTSVSASGGSEACTACRLNLPQQLNKRVGTKVQSQEPYPSPCQEDNFVKSGRNLSELPNASYAVSVDLPCNRLDQTLRDCHRFSSNLVDSELQPTYQVLNCVQCTKVAETCKPLAAVDLSHALGAEHIHVLQRCALEEQDVYENYSQSCNTAIPRVAITNNSRSNPYSEYLLPKDVHCEAHPAHPHVIYIAYASEVYQSLEYPLSFSSVVFANTTSDIVLIPELPKISYCVAVYTRDTQVPNILNFNHSETLSTPVGGDENVHNLPLMPVFNCLKCCTASEIRKNASNKRLTAKLVGEHFANLVKQFDCIGVKSLCSQTTSYPSQSECKILTKEVLNSKATGSQMITTPRTISTGNLMLPITIEDDIQMPSTPSLLVQDQGPSHSDFVTESSNIITDLSSNIFTVPKEDTFEEYVLAPEPSVLVTNTVSLTTLDHQSTQSSNGVVVNSAQRTKCILSVNCSVQTPDDTQWFDSTTTFLDYGEDQTTDNSHSHIIRIFEDKSTGMHCARHWSESTQTASREHCAFTACSEKELVNTGVQTDDALASPQSPDPQLKKELKECEREHNLHISKSKLSSRFRKMQGISQQTSCLYFVDKHVQTVSDLCLSVLVLTKSANTQSDFDSVNKNNQTICCSYKNMLVQTMNRQVYNSNVKSGDKCTCLNFETHQRMYPRNSLLLGQSTQPTDQALNLTDSVIEVSSNFGEPRPNTSDEYVLASSPSDLTTIISSTRFQDKLSRACSAIDVGVCHSDCQTEISLSRDHSTMTDATASLEVYPGISSPATTKIPSRNLVELGNNISLFECTFSEHLAPNSEVSVYADALGNSKGIDVGVEAGNYLHLPQVKETQTRELGNYVHNNILLC